MGYKRNSCDGIGFGKYLLNIIFIYLVFGGYLKFWIILFFFSLKIELKFVINLYIEVDMSIDG